MLYSHRFFFALLLLVRVFFFLFSCISEQEYKNSRELFTVDGAMIDGTHNTLLDIDPIKCAANKIIAVVVFD